MTVLLALAIAGLVLWTGLGLDLAIGGRSILKLRDVPPASGESLARVSIVIAPPVRDLRQPRQPL